MFNLPTYKMQSSKPQCFETKSKSRGRRLQSSVKASIVLSKISEICPRGSVPGCGIVGLWSVSFSSVYIAKLVIQLNSVCRLFHTYLYLGSVTLSTLFYMRLYLVPVRLFTHKYFHKVKFHAVVWSFCFWRVWFFVIAEYRQTSCLHTDCNLHRDCEFKVCF